MRVIIVLFVALIFSATSASAVKRGGGALGFECTVGGKCYCDGPVESADCKGAAKNCSDGVKCPCGWAVDNCCCTYSLKKPPSGGKAGGAAAPRAGTKAQ